MGKNAKMVIGLIVIIVLIVVGYAIFHKSPKTITYSYKSSGSSSSSQSAAVNNSVVTTKTASGVGQYLADPNGNALYTYSSDTNGVSNCTSSCLASWPAYQDKGATTGLPTNIGTIKRTDNGQTQYTYKRLPLYTFTGDSAGQVTGNGEAGFQVAKP